MTGLLPPPRDATKSYLNTYNERRTSLPGARRAVLSSLLCDHFQSLKIRERRQPRGERVRVCICISLVRVSSGLVAPANSATVAKLLNSGATAEPDHSLADTNLDMERNRAYCCQTHAAAAIASSGLSTNLPNDSFAKHKM